MQSSTQLVWDQDGDEGSITGEDATKLGYLPMGLTTVETREIDWVVRMENKESSLLVGKREVWMKSWMTGKRVSIESAQDHKSHGYKAKQVKPPLDIINVSYHNYYGSKIQLKK